jgi:NifU-like protein involved in Fe-S cluster formation
MSTDPYSRTVRDLFANPAHAGCLDGGMRASADDQGVRLCLCAKQVGGVISALRFKAWGCPHLIAAAEAVCAEYEGRAVDELLEFRAFDLMQSLPVPVEKTGRILVLEDAVRTLGAALGQTIEKD